MLAPLLNPKRSALCDLQMREQRGDVVRRGREADRRIAVAGAPVRLLLDGDHAAVAREERQDASERNVDRRATAVQEDEGHATFRTVGLVVHPDAVHLGRRLQLSEFAGSARRMT